MIIFKKLVENKFINYVIRIILTFYIKFVYKTSRWEVDGLEYLDQYYSQKKPAIFIFWHGRLALMPNLRPHDRNMGVIISTHRDGRFIADVVRNFKLKIIEGSTNKNGSKALREAIKKLKNNYNVGISPDGPRGPRMRVNSNLAAIAGMTNSIIVPMTFSCKKYKLINSWDKLMFPLPFNKGIIIYGKPIKVPNDKKSFEDYKDVIENTLNEITFKADRILNIKDQIKPE